MHRLSGPLIPTAMHVVTLEKIQRRAARFVCNNYSKYDSVTDMLTLLNWASLEQRRNQAKCIMFYKIWCLLILTITYSNPYPIHEGTV